MTGACHLTCARRVGLVRGPLWYRDQSRTADHVESLVESVSKKPYVRFT